ncbi:hypothetical protein DIPPA_30590 [Diplonema papillatum]|nr:hypothetical protein DIPPA_30590 [Diplonema papillatum]
MKNTAGLLRKAWQPAATGCRMDAAHAGKTDAFRRTSMVPQVEDLMKNIHRRLQATGVDRYKTRTAWDALKADLVRLRELKTRCDRHMCDNIDDFVDMSLSGATGVRFDTVVWTDAGVGGMCAIVRRWHGGSYSITGKPPFKGNAGAELYAALRGIRMALSHPEAMRILLFTDSHRSATLLTTVFKSTLPSPAPSPGEETTPDAKTQPRKPAFIRNGRGLLTSRRALVPEQVIAAVRGYRTFKRAGNRKVLLRNLVACVSQLRARQGATIDVKHLPRDYNPADAGTRGTADALTKTELSDELPADCGALAGEDGFIYDQSFLREHHMGAIKRRFDLFSDRNVVNKVKAFRKDPVREMRAHAANPHRKDARERRTRMLDKLFK